MILAIEPTKKLAGKICVPGDKSISHRSIMLAALAEGNTVIEGFLRAEDCLSTVSCFRQLGVNIEVGEHSVRVEGRGLHGLREADDVLNVGNSGTTIRLLSGILAGQPFTSFLTGDSSIRRRPMSRVIEPLSQMGAQITARAEGQKAPLSIRGSQLQPLRYQSKIASAQVKSAILLAGLFADGWSEVSEPFCSRNHSELMLKAFGADVEIDDTTARVKGYPHLQAQNITVPGDLSSAAFFMVAASIVPNAQVRINSVGLNSTRDGIIDVLREMGAKIKITNVRTTAGELYGDLEVESSELHGVNIGGSIIPRLIDEIPILTVAAAYAQGVTEIRDASELKVKESNRLAAISDGLTKMGADVQELPDGLRINGGRALTGATTHSYHDHRIVMSLAIAALGATGTTYIEDAEAVSISFPQFNDLLAELRRD